MANLCDSERRRHSRMSLLFSKSTHITVLKRTEHRQGDTPLGKHNCRLTVSDKDEEGSFGSCSISHRRVPLSMVILLSCLIKM